VRLTNPRGEATTWIASKHPAAILYGVIITGAVISATAGHETTGGSLVSATLFVLVVYWLADLYVRAFAEPFTGTRRPLSQRLQAAAAREAAVLLGVGARTGGRDVPRRGDRGSRSRRRALADRG
jgi:hypothetical protein